MGRLWCNGKRDRRLQRSKKRRWDPLSSFLSFLLGCSPVSRKPKSGDPTSLFRSSPEQPVGLAGWTFRDRSCVGRDCLLHGLTFSLLLLQLLTCCTHLTPHLHRDSNSAAIAARVQRLCKENGCPSQKGLVGLRDYWRRQHLGCRT